MLDELAQYAARLETAIPNGGNQLAAFLMGLHGYARTHAGIAVVLTLASQADAFARQTQRLTELLTEVQGEEITEETALGIAQHADTRGPERRGAGCCDRDPSPGRRNLQGAREASVCLYRSARRA